MPAQTVNYQCPACTGPLHFVGQSGKLECDYCGSSYTVEEIEALYGDKEKQAAQAKNTADAAPKDDSYDGWDQNLKSYSCPSCGAELVCDETTAATACPYCGNPTVVPGQLHGMLKPDYVIPFQLDKEAAVAALKKYYKGKRFLPKTFSTDNHIEEIKGIYVPFWLFDGSAQADLNATATRSTVRRTSNEEIITTQHFIVERSGTVEFQRVPVDGSSKMPDAHMDAIEPFDYAQLRDFSTAYLPGFLADKYDVDAQQCQQRVDERLEHSAISMLQDTIVGYETCATVNKNVDIQHGDVKYALLPVWTLHTKWQGKDYLFAMNGQTGKLIGDLPVSKGKFAAWMAGISVPLMVILAFVTGLL